MSRPQQYKPQIFLSISLRLIFSAIALMLAPSLVADEPVKVVIWAEGNMAYATVDGERQDPFDISTFIEKQQRYIHTCMEATNLTIEDSFPLAVEIKGSDGADILVYKGSRSAEIRGGGVLIRSLEGPVTTPFTAKLGKMSSKVEREMTRSMGEMIKTRSAAVWVTIRLMQVREMTPSKGGEATIEFVGARTPMSCGVTKGLT